MDNIIDEIKTSYPRLAEIYLPKMPTEKDNKQNHLKDKEKKKIHLK